MGLSLTTTTGKVLASLALVGTAAGVAGLGTYGAFSSTTRAETEVVTGAVTVGLGAPGVANRLNVAAADLLAGDKVERTVTLKNVGEQDFSTVKLSTVATVSSALDTDPTNGLKLLVESCPVAWTESGTYPAFKYTCPGNLSTILVAEQPVVLAAPVVLEGLKARTAKQSDYLRVTMTLSTEATEAFAGLKSAIAFNFTATQRTGMNK
jgi:spore coat-associated protein N